MAIRSSVTISVAVIVLLVSPPALTQTLKGKVVRVVDGDSFELETRNRRVTVRLAGVDAPEIGQKGAGNAYNRLREMIGGEWVTVKTAGRDCHQRAVAEVFVGGGNVGAGLVAEGLAWVSGEYSSDLSLIQHQTSAKKRHLGIWAHGEPVPPWQWREQHPEQSRFQC